MLHIAQAIVVAVFPALVIVAALRDAVSYRIPNWISLALIAGFALAGPLLGLGLPDIGLHIGVGAAALVLGFVMYSFRWIGGGDAKLFAVAALWLGWPAVTTYALTTTIAGGVLAVSLLALRSPYLRPWVVTAPAWLGRLAEPGEAVPYGLAIAVGALAAFPESPLLIPFAGL